MTFTKPPFWASLLTLCGVIMLCGLGTWQADKYLDKISGRGEALCESGKARVVADSYLNLDQIPQIKCPGLISLVGEVAIDKPVSIGPRMHKGTMGYYLYAPLRANDGSLIFINFGWSDKKTLSFEQGKSIRVSGAFLPPPQGNMFSPENKPEQNEWFYMDIYKAAQYFDLQNVAPFIVYAQMIEPNMIGQFMPAELSKTYLTPQTHLQYAAFWYFMAFALIGVYLLRFVFAKK